MDKLELDLNDLKVDSFKTNPDQEDERGTVHGNITQDPDRCETKIGGTCDFTCEDTCVNTCDLTCSPWCSELACPQ